MFNFGGGPSANFILNGVLKSKSFFHAYLFCGDDFIGKRSVAKKFAMAIFCCSDKIRPCFECEICRKFLNGNYVDFCEISTAEFLKVGSFSVQQARQLISDSFIKPLEGQFKIFLLKRVDELLPAAANVLLKLLEEPPKNVIFLLTASNRFDVLQTIASRCFLVNVFGEGTRFCLDALKREGFDDHKLKNVIMFSEGSLNKAKLLLTNSDWQMALDIACGLFHAYFSENELEFLKFIFKIEQNPSLVMLVFRFFSLNLSVFVRKELGQEDKLNLKFLKEIGRVLGCFEQVQMALTKNSNLKLALVGLCCSVFSKNRGW